MFLFSRTSRLPGEILVIVRMHKIYNNFAQHKENASNSENMWIKATTYANKKIISGHE